MYVIMALQRIAKDKNADKDYEWNLIHEGSKLENILEKERNIVKRYILPIFILSFLALVISLNKTVVIN